MRLSDIVSHLDLAAYPQAALVLFLTVFACVAWRVFRAPGAEMSHFARIPLERSEHSEDRRHDEPR